MYAVTASGSTALSAEVAQLEAAVKVADARVRGLFDALSAANQELDNFLGLHGARLRDARRSIAVEAQQAAVDALAACESTLSAFGRELAVNAALRPQPADAIKMARAMSVRADRPWLNDPLGEAGVRDVIGRLWKLLSTLQPGDEPFVLGEPLDLEALNA